MSKCKACGAEIGWIKMKSGKSMPVDIRDTHYEDPAGQAVIVTEDGRISHGRAAVIFSPGKTKGWPSHFSTCPKADEMRKRERNGKNG